MPLSRAALCVSHSYQQFIFSAVCEGGLKWLLEQSCLGSQQVMVTGVTKCVSCLQCSGFGGIYSVLGSGLFSAALLLPREFSTLSESSLPWS